MTDQQPHMPLDGLVLRMHIHFGAANAAGDDYSADDFADVIRILENLAADIAAAEQRGAYRAACQAFRHAATAFDYPEATDQWCTWADVATWLRANADKHDPDNRADQMEGNDE